MTEGTWVQCTITGDLPGRRYGCAECRVEDRWYIYGGACMGENGTNQYFDETFILSLNGTSISSKKVGPTAVTPGPRVGGHLVQFDNFLYLYGGTSNDFTLEHSRGLYKFDTSSFTWYEVSLLDDPCVVSQSISVSRSSVLYMFGGVALDEPSNNLFTLDLNKSPLKWTGVETQGTAPLPRVDHCSVIVDNRLYVFGGSGSHILWYNDMHVLDLTTLTWSVLKVSSEVYPLPCDFSTLSSYDSNYILLFGGSNDSMPDVVFNKMWYYSTSSNSWYRCDVLGSEPAARYVHSTTVYSNLLYVFGGLNTETLQDCWVLQLHDNNLRGRVLQQCKIENPPPPLTEFKVQQEIPKAPAITNFEIPDIEKHTGLDKLKASVIGQIRAGFETLEAEYAALYAAKEELEKEQVKVAQCREHHETWVLEQRDDLVRQCEEHTELCRNWAALQTDQFGRERTILVEERKRLERAQRRLAADQDILNKRVKKLEELISRTKIK